MYTVLFPGANLVCFVLFCFVLFCGEFPWVLLSTDRSTLALYCKPTSFPYVQETFAPFCLIFSFDGLQLHLG